MLHVRNKQQRQGKQQYKRRRKSPPAQVKVTRHRVSIVLELQTRKAPQFAGPFLVSS